MSYVNPDYKSKKEFKAAVTRANALAHIARTETDTVFVLECARLLGRPSTHETYSHAGIFPTPKSGEDLIEGPHYPKPHRWYARVRVENGRVVKVLS